jgi:PQQ-like domain
MTISCGPSTPPTGTFLWYFEANSPIESSPAVANGVVYAGSDDDNLYALNAANGTGPKTGLQLGARQRPAARSAAGLG